MRIRRDADGFLLFGGIIIKPAFPFLPLSILNTKLEEVYRDGQAVLFRVVAP
jgi:hypothetical protein